MQQFQFILFMYFQIGQPIRAIYSIELYANANSALPRRQTSITDNYDEQLQCTVRNLLNR